MPAPLELPSALLAEAASWVASRYPQEGCGLILRRGQTWRFLAMENVATRYHLADPQSFPLDARRAYLFDPEEQRERWRWAAAEGYSIAFIVHSHPDAPPCFSQMDREMAMASASNPLHPGVDYLVFEVRAGLPGKARAYTWAEGAWRCRDVEARTFSGS